MSENSSNLLAVTRHQIILDILKREGVVRSAELRDLLNVSLVTIRNDLKELEKSGECEIIWGGAVSRKLSTDFESRLEEKSKLHFEEKQRIGKRAAQLVKEGQTIMVDAGTTTIELIHSLSQELDYLRVITPALNVAVATSHFPNIELIMPAGVVRNLTRSLVGPQTLLSLQSHHADWAFIATSGFSVERGVTTGNILEVDVKRAMVRQSDKVALITDSSKLGRTLSLTVAPLSAFDVIITDTGLPKSAKSAIGEHIKDVICV